MFGTSRKNEPDVVLETERLRLRKLAKDDAAFILELVNDPDWLRHIGDRGVRSLKDASEFIAEGPLASYSSYGYGLWLVELKESSIPIGLCGVLKRKHLEHPDLGYALLPQFRGQGFAIESCRGVLSYARLKLAMSQVLAIVSPANARSIGLLEKLSFVRAGTATMPGQSEEVLLFHADLKQE